MRRSLAGGWRWLLLAGAAVAAATPARAHQVTFSPAAPTWKEDVVVTVAGTGCGSSLAVLPPANGRSQLELRGLCGAAAPRPFVLTANLGALGPGTQEVVIHEEQTQTNSTAALAVYEAGRLQLDLPVATAGAPATIRVRAWGEYSDLELATPTVTGNVITVERPRTCCVTLPLGYAVSELTTTVGPLPAGDYEVRLLDGEYRQVPTLVRGTLRVLPAGACLAGGDVLCLQDGRFRLEGTWRDFDGGTGVMHARPLADNDGSGLLWFFQPDNVELTVKVLDACGLDGHWWVFVSSGSTVEYDLRVTDTQNGATHTYHHTAGELPALVTDLGRFSCQ